MLSQNGRVQNAQNAIHLSFLVTCSEAHDCMNLIRNIMNVIN